MARGGRSAGAAFSMTRGLSATAPGAAIAWRVGRASARQRKWRRGFAMRARRGRRLRRASSIPAAMQRMAATMVTVMSNSPEKPAARRRA
jgi:hypothetical protein